LSKKEQLIDDPTRWFTFLEYRNLTVDICNEDVAEKIYDGFGDFKQALQQFTDVIQTL